MAIYICMDGLGGHPSLTFSRLKKVLEDKGNNVILLEVNGIKTHNERVERIVNCYRNQREKRQGEKIFLVGQSAGGGAVRSAMERIEKDGATISGAILLSPSSPKFVWFATITLLMVMAKHILEILFSRWVWLRRSEVSKLLAPIDKKLLPEKVRPISVIEAMELAFWPSKLKKTNFPILLIYGDHDKWISPNAHRKFKKMLVDLGVKVNEVIIEGAGHSTLLSDDPDRVIKIIKKWTNV